MKIDPIVSDESRIEKYGWSDDSEKVNGRVLIFINVFFLFYKMFQWGKFEKRSVYNLLAMVSKPNK